MKKMYYIMPLLLLSLLVGCQNDIPEPETKDISFQLDKAVQASGYQVVQADPFFVKHQVKGKNVYIECMVKDISFRNNGAKIVLSIDGKKNKEIKQAAFIVKELQSGTHQLKLELFKQNEHSAKAIKEIEVVIL
ncbi:hypothetical protein JMM81_09240 [Bacillus sp. V3B]|uniref:hypothetical protein n=1 Tax=Bacillus sp. V3B TaxID=2804915 RepID=UPI00210A447B|nr:hypothetical protein [Bacillus sp. V3B]MCQ6275145.1 hypothetical protein [Bacillus sp. V3B]